MYFFCILLIDIYVTMLKKLSGILMYYDSEPLEILMAIIWLVFFPIIWSCQFGIQLILIIISVLLGASILKSICNGMLPQRKTLAYASFLFSIVILILLILNKGILIPSNWTCFLALIISIINLIQTTSQYYRKQI